MRLAKSCWLSRFARYPGLLLAVAVWFVWSVLMTWDDRWSLFVDGWIISITMAFGSFIAGSTSEGGGAVAFPVMTLLFGIEPIVARDFSLMIQAVGMTAASVTIWRTGIRVEPVAILFASIGGAIGVVASIQWVAPLLEPATTKMFFVSLWLSFGIALLWMNRHRSRETLKRIKGLRMIDAVGLLAYGLVGGVVSGITGTGLDIVTFSLLVLTFRIDELVATPTSVVLMSGNSLIGVTWRLFAGNLLGSNAIRAEAWEYWWVSVPVVVVGAPLGARFIASRSRFFVVVLLCSTIAIQFLGALVILPGTAYLYVLSASTVAVGLVLFTSMVGGGRLRWSLSGTRR